MRILALDTATFVASVAITEGAEVVAELDARVSTHSEMLLPLIARALDAAKLTPGQLDLVACGSGPGSFTGLRIGLATAKGLCVALAKPLVMASSLATLALDGAPAGEHVLALLDARRREVYAGLYRIAEGLPVPLLPEAVLAPDRVAPWVRAAGDLAPIVLGDGALAYPEAAAAAGRVLVDARSTPRAAQLARLASARYAAGSHDDLTTAAPTYVRPPEVE